MAKQKIAAVPSIRRLPSYLHIIRQSKDEGSEYISGTVIAQELHLEPIQVRKDLAITGIVVYDATGVRRQAGFHAERINQIVRELLHLKKLEESEVSYLREIIGHTPGEAVAGVLFGMMIAFAVQWVMVWR